MTQAADAQRNGTAGARRNAVALLVPLAIYGAMVALFELTPLDASVQELFFDRGAGQWLVAKDDLLLRTILYTGPKVVLVGLGIAAFAAVLWIGFRQRRLLRGVLVLALSLALIPLAVGQLKRVTGVHCPDDLVPYGGPVPFVSLLEPYPESHTTWPGRCYPAGHASGGFALFGTVALARNRRERHLGIALGMGAGWIMALYQMARGVHFLSHGLATMLLAWFTVSLLIWLLLRPGPDRT